MKRSLAIKKQFDNKDRFQFALSPEITALSLSKFIKESEAKQVVVKSVDAILKEKKEILVGVFSGEKIKVETPTSLLGVLNFANKTKVQLFASWDVWKHEHSAIELYGLEGSMIIPDPNYFGGELKLSKKDSDWEVIDTKNMILGTPNTEEGDGMVANYRGIGLSDMVNCIKERKKARCSIDLNLHVLEIMDGILISSENSSIYKTITSCDKPEYLDEKEIKSLRTN